MCPQSEQDAAFSLLIVNQQYKKCVFKASGRLLFRMLNINQYCMKNVCSEGAVDCFLVYSALISIVRLKWFTTNFIL